MLLSALGACSSWNAPPPERAPVEDSLPVTDAGREAAAAPEPVVEAPAPTVAVVLFRSAPVFGAVADALERSLEGRAVRYEIDDQNRDRVLGDLRAAGHAGAVAIGHQALRLLDETDLAITYCQVLEPGAQRTGRRGVAPLPTYGAQLDAWRQHQPDLARIGMVTGPGHDAAAAALADAAGERALKVRHAVARSDREMLHLFQRMVPEIEGFLLYPDARILSPRTLRALLAYANKHGVWVLTYNRSIFDLGATLLVSTDPQEIAFQVVAALESTGPEGRPLPLHRALVERQGGGQPLVQAAP